MTFNEYWNQYGELHAASCGGSIRLFAEEIWKSAQENAMSDAIPREAVQAAVDRIRDCADVLRREGCEPLGHDNALMHIANHTGVTPTEVTP